MLRSFSVVKCWAWHPTGPDPDEVQMALRDTRGSKRRLDQVLPASRVQINPLAHLKAPRPKTFSLSRSCQPSDETEVSFEGQRLGSKVALMTHCVNKMWFRVTTLLLNETLFQAYVFPRHQGGWSAGETAGRRSFEAPRRQRWHAAHAWRTRRRRHLQRKTT